MLPPFASVFDLPQATSTAGNPSRPSTSRDFLDFVSVDIPRASTNFPDLPQASRNFFDVLRPWNFSHSIDLFFRFLRAFAHFSDLARAYSN
jgi:hypothetical protein